MTTLSPPSPQRPLQEYVSYFAQATPDKLAWSFLNDNLEVTEAFTYKEIENASNALAKHLREDCKLNHGDKVLLVFPPTSLFALGLLACFKANLIAVPVMPPNPMNRAVNDKNMLKIKADCGATVAMTCNSYMYAKNVSNIKNWFTGGPNDPAADLTWIAIDSVVNKAKSQIHPHPYPDEPSNNMAFFQYTSGSTGDPKGVMVSQANLTHANNQAEQFYDADNSMVTVTWLPHYHDFGLYITALTLKTGGTGYVMSPLAFMKDPIVYLRAITKYRATYSGVANFAYGLMARKFRELEASGKADKDLDLSSLVTVLSAAEPITCEDLRAFFDAFRPHGFNPDAVSLGIGMAEHTLDIIGGRRPSVIYVKRAALEENQVEIVAVEYVDQALNKKPISVSLEGTAAIVSVGQINPGKHLNVNHKIGAEPIICKVVDPVTKEELPDGQIGEMWSYSPSKCLGYWNKPELTKEIFGGKISNAQGKPYENLEFLRTGDLIFVHEGLGYFCSRLKDLIIVGGANYYPHDIEVTAFRSHKLIRPGCVAAFAVKVPGELTESAVVVAELQNGVPANKHKEIADAILNAVSSEQGLFLAEILLLKTRTINKTSSGKVSRSGNLKLYKQNKLDVVYRWKSTADDEVDSETIREYTVEEVQAFLSEKIQALLNLPEKPSLTQGLMDLGLSSMESASLGAQLSTKFGLKIRPAIVVACPTIGEMSKYIVRELKKKVAEKNGVDIVTEEVEETSAETEVEEVDYAKYEAHLCSFGTCVPAPISTERWLEVDRQVRASLGQDDSVHETVASLAKASKIKNRHSCHPFFVADNADPSDLKRIGMMDRDIYTNNIDPPYYQRMACYKDTVIKICVEAARKAVNSWNMDKSNITHVITTCTSGWNEPGIACSVIKELGLIQDIQKCELNYNGCFCGATCLRLARDIIRSGSSTGVLIVACEVSTSHYRYKDTDKEMLVAQSLFADGAAAFIVGRSGEWRFSKTGGSMVPESSDLLGLRPPMYEDDTTVRMTLSPKVGPSLFKYFNEGHGKELLKKMYNPKEPRPALAVHPGGPRILEAVGEVLYGLGWKDDSLEASYETFAQNGNLGSAAMLFVLAQRLERKDIAEDKLMTMAFGPGVTVEWAVYERSTVPRKNALHAGTASAEAVAADVAAVPQAKNSSGSSTSMLLLLVLILSIVANFYLAGPMLSQRV